MNTKHTPIAAATKFVASAQQSAFFDWVVNGTGSCVLEAVAGAGKTSTLVHSLTLMSGKIFFGAFSKDIVREIESRVPSDLKDRVKVSTMHAEGFSALRRAFRNVRVDGNKCFDIFDNMYAYDPQFAILRGTVVQLVSLAKQSGIGITKPIHNFDAWHHLIKHYDLDLFDDVSTMSIENIIQAAQTVLGASNRACERVIDFDDMIYAPLLMKLKFFQYDWVLIDEAQDTNEIRRLLALAILKPKGRLVAVGDRHQAIFGFTGADSNSLELIAESVKATRLPLTVTYRCPKAIVAHAQQWVQHIQAAETAPEGIVKEASADELTKLINVGDAVLCRFNAPLVSYVYNFIGAGIPAVIEGRDISEGLIRLAKRWKRVGSYTKLLDNLETFEEREIAKLTEKDLTNRIPALTDKISCLRVVIARAEVVNPDPKSVVQAVVDQIDTIFAKDKNGAIDKSKVVTFSSGHRSKGREWNRVVWLVTPFNKRAQMEWEIQQEDNLSYVMATRAKQELILVEVKK